MSFIDWRCSKVRHRYMLTLRLGHRGHLTVELATCEEGKKLRNNTLSIPRLCDKYPILSVEYKRPQRSTCSSFAVNPNASSTAFLMLFNCSSLPLAARIWSCSFRRTCPFPWPLSSRRSSRSSFERSLWAAF